MQRHGQVRAQGRALPCPNILPEMPQTPLSCKQPVCIDSKRSGYTGKAFSKHPVSSNSICVYGTRQTVALKEQHYWRGSSNGRLWVMKSCFLRWLNCWTSQTRAFQGYGKAREQVTQVERTEKEAASPHKPQQSSTLSALRTTLPNLHTFF